jgi:hypothetical protein
LEAVEAGLRNLEAGGVRLGKAGVRLRGWWGRLGRFFDI